MRGADLLLREVGHPLMCTSGTSVNWEHAWVLVNLRDPLSGEVQATLLDDRVTRITEQQLGDVLGYPGDYYGNLIVHYRLREGDRARVMLEYWASDSDRAAKHFAAVQEALADVADLDLHIRRRA